MVCVCVYFFVKVSNRIEEPFDSLGDNKGQELIILSEETGSLGLMRKAG
jgi:hypothetical protein